MKNKIRFGIASAAAAVTLLLSACGGSEPGGAAQSTANEVSARSAASAGAARAGFSSSELIDAAQGRGDLDADTALAYKVYALFRDARLPAAFQGGASEEIDSALLAELAAAFDALAPAAQQALAPFLQRPAQAGSWAARAQTAREARETQREARAASTCALAARWTTIEPALGAKVRVWYDAGITGDQSTAAAVSHAIHRDIWPALTSASGLEPLLADAASPGCDGGDARHDVYLVHGIAARGLTVPVRTGGAPAAVNAGANSGASPSANPGASFTLINADAGTDAIAAAAQLLADATQLAMQAAARQAPPSSGRRTSLAAAGALRATNVKALATTAPAPSVLQARSASLSSGTVSVTLNSAVTAGNWIAVAVSSIGTAPRNVTLTDNQGHADVNIAATASRYSGSFGTVWRYVKASASGSYTITANRGGATSGTLQVLEIGGADASVLLDIASVSASGSGTQPSTLFGSNTTRDNDLLLSVVAARSATVVITPTTPGGVVAVDQVQTSAATARVMALPTSSVGTYPLGAALSTASAWRMSSIAVRGAAPAPVVVAPVNTALPVITVTDKTTYLTLTTSQGAWSNSPTAYAYAWTRDGAPIAGATLASYDTTIADQGKSVAAVVTAGNSAGSASAVSAAVPVPVPGTPQAPAVALSAAPASITQGQPSTLSWSSTNATACSASGAWSGTKALSGTAAVTPAATAVYTLTCTGAGGSTAASATVQVTAPPAGSDPTLGAHGLVYHRSQGSVGPTLSTPAATTQSGSTMLAFAGKGSIWNLSPPTDNKGNTPYLQIGTIHEYKRWPGQGTAMYAFNSIVGGANHIVGIDDSNVWDEVTFATIEVRNGGLIQDFKWNEVLNSTTQTSLSVTTTGPATLVAVWFGDDASATPSNPVPNNGFTVIDRQVNSTEAVAMFVATKDVPAAGTYNVTWTTTPLQGAQLYLVAVQRR
jgi:hypothetical protein